MTATEETRLMQEQDAVIAGRFFKVIHMLVKRGVIRGKKTFTDEYNINRWNFNTLEKELDRGIFHICWLTYLVRDYGVSAEWLLTGKGKAFDE